MTQEKYQCKIKTITGKVHEISYDNEDVMMHALNKSYLKIKIHHHHSASLYSLKCYFLIPKEQIEYIELKIH